MIENITLYLEITSNTKIKINLATSDQHSDAPLLVRIKKGDVHAFETIFNKYKERLYHFARRYLYSKEDAEEIVQEVFIKIWENKERLQEDLSFYSYLFTSCKNTIFNQNRKKINEQAYYNYVKVFIQNVSHKTDNDIIYADLEKMIGKVIDNLPAQRKNVYLLSRNNGLTHKEIAAKLSISVKTVEAHMRLALKTIKGVLDKELVMFLILLGLLG